ncbi:AAA family ATPase [Hymenobacter profundi]|uniref:AAA family ATPase n=1 Tax=Hymenobacter profundi TaxID=1982110 RepID=A0ABS6WYV5_9BACT|nr:AAA family ATPase [Hymenobacter profundi]MBW3128782.1 AAA family ATPase [Hymenobacter profundi]
MTEKTQTPLPAYFLSLSLENVRSFGEKQTISFARPDGRPAQWTIILGDNGVGKTTVLKSLAGVSLFPKLPKPAKEEDGIQIDLWKELGVSKSAEAEPAYTKIWKVWPAIRNGRQSNNEIRKDTTWGLPSSITNNPDFKVAMFWCEACVGDVFQHSHPVSIASYNMTARYIGSNSIGRGWSSIPYNLVSLLCYGYGAGRTIGNSTLTETPDTSDSYTSLFDDRADLLNPEEWFLQMEYSSLKQDKKAGKALEQVRQALLLVLPDVTDIRISSKGHQQYLELETPYGWVRLRDMSLGYQTLVVWLTDFASKLFLRYPDSKNPLEEPAIVLIDEIDLHLHPSWQRKLLGFLSGIFKNTQFIATAHSPLVVQAAGDEGANVVLLKREGDQTVVVTDVEDVRGWRVDQILTSSFYNLETARSLETEKKLERQAILLNKKKLTAKERQELDALTLELEGQPMGSTGNEEEEAELLRQITERLGAGSSK